MANLYEFCGCWECREWELNVFLPPWFCKHKMYKSVPRKKRTHSYRVKFQSFGQLVNDDSKIENVRSSDRATTESDFENEWIQFTDLTHDEDNESQEIVNKELCSRCTVCQKFRR